MVMRDKRRRCVSVSRAKQDRQEDVPFVDYCTKNYTGSTITMAWTRGRCRRPSLGRARIALHVAASEGNDQGAYLAVAGADVSQEDTAPAASGRGRPSLVNAHHHHLFGRAGGDVDLTGQWRRRKENKGYATMELARSEIVPRALIRGR